MFPRPKRIDGPSKLISSPLSSFSSLKKKIIRFRFSGRKEKHLAILESH